MVIETLNIDGERRQVSEETLQMVETLEGEAPGLMGLLAQRLPQSARRLAGPSDGAEARSDGGFAGQEPKMREVLPPYASYSSWVRLLEALARTLPPILDESHLTALDFTPSSSIKPLRSALRFFALVGTDNRPTGKLERLVRALRSGETAKAETLREMVYQSYGTLFSPGFDLKSATTAELRRRFGAMGARGQIQQKCCSFFLNLARDAGLELPPQLLSRAPLALSRHKGSPATWETSQLPARLWGQERGPSTAGPSRLPGFLPDLFPMFDVDWPDEKKQRWFTDFATLMNIYIRNGDHLDG